MTMTCAPGNMVDAKLSHAVVFDLDDTLYPERQFAESGFRAVAQAFQDQLGPPADALARMLVLFDSPNRARVFNALLEPLNQSDADKLVPAMIYVYRHHAPSITLHPDADRAITRLQGQYKIGLITDGFTHVQHRKIDALCLRGRLDEIIVTDDLGGSEFRKPHPRAYEEMARRLNVPHAQCTYVADNLSKDFIAPNALGWQTVFIRRPAALYVASQAAPDGRPEHVIDSLDELSSIVNRRRKHGLL